MTDHVQVYPGSLGEIRAASAAGGGTGLTTTALVIPFPDGTSQIAVISRNFTTAVAIKIAINPYLTILKTSDGLLLPANTVDLSQAAQQPGALTPPNINLLDTLANLDFLMVGSWTQFRGLIVDMLAGHVNTGAASTLLAEYWNGTAWVSLAATDGTAAGGKTFAQDGNITWAVPAAWVSQAQDSAPLGFIAAGAKLPIVGNFPTWWVRLSVSAAMSADVQITSMYALNRSTAYAEFPVGYGFEEVVTKAVGGVSCLEALTDAGTANLIVNCFTRSQARFL